MGHAAPQSRRYTTAEYFALEAQSKVKHEFFDGEVFAMAGGSKSHNLLALNLVVALRGSLKGKKCQVFSSDVRLMVQADFQYVYPDVVVSCDPDDQRNEYEVRQPVLIVEVLSPSTANYDRTEKFKQYQKISSLRHYVLVQQDQWFVEWFRRNEAGEWVLQLLNEPIDVLIIPDLNLRLPLAELYEGTTVSPLRVEPPARR